MRTIRQLYSLTMEGEKVLPPVKPGIPVVLIVIQSQWTIRRRKRLYIRYLVEYDDIKNGISLSNPKAAKECIKYIPLL